MDKKKLNLIGLILLLVFTTLNSYAVLRPTKQIMDSLNAIPNKNVNDQLYYYIYSANYFKNKDPKIQVSYLDSARVLVPQATSMDHIAMLYNYYATYYAASNNPDSAILYYHKSYYTSSSNNQIQNTGRALLILSSFHVKQDNYDSGFYYLNKGLDYYNQIDTSLLDMHKDAYLGQININIGSIYLNKGNYDKAIEYYYKAIRLYESAGSKRHQIKAIINLGNIYIFNKRYDKAIEEYSKALDIAEAVGGKVIHQKASIYTNLGSCYKAKGSLDTAMMYYNKALDIRTKSGVKYAIAGLSDNIGNIKKARGDYEGALSEFKKALKIRQEGSSKRGLASSYGNIGLLYAKMLKSRESIPYLKRAIEIADSNSFVEISLVCQEGISVAYRDLGDYKRSLETYVKYRKMNDSIHNIRLEEKLNLYKEKYEAEKKDRLIQKLEEQQLLDELAAEKQKAIVSQQRLISSSLAALAVLLLIILFITYRYFKMKGRANRELMLRKDQVNQQKTLDLMKDQEISTIKSYMEGQEKERSRIAGDLHDRLGSLLSTVKLHFSSLEENVDPGKEARESFHYALQLLDDSVDEVRSVSRNLTTGVLTQFGLFAAVESMKEAINSARKIKMHIIRSGTEMRLDVDVEINLFRIIQELVTNVIRHAHTDEIFVQFVGNDNRLNIIIEDHGIGFNMKNIESEGIGLSNMKDRVESIGGVFSIDSVVGEGTTIIIDIPYKTLD